MAKPTGGRPPTMDDVAVAAGVSRALVSLVMRESPKVSPERRQRVLQAAETLGYRPNAMARNLARRRTKTIGVLLNDLHNPFFADIAGGIEDLASELGYHLMLGTGRRNLQRERSVLASLLEYRVDGVIAVSPRIPAAGILSAATDTPLVLIGRSVRDRSIDTVQIDEIAGTRAVIRHLAGLGHRDVVHIDGGDGAGSVQRRAGFEQATGEVFGRTGQVVPGDFTEAAGIAAADGFLASGDLPTAVFAANDLVATGVIETVERAGLMVPRDMSVIGYDNTYLAGLRQIALTTVHQPRVEMGRLGLELLLERLEGRTESVDRLVEPRLIVRTTTGRAPERAVARERRRSGRPDSDR